jgi:protein-disulfide isomerase
MQIRRISRYGLVLALTFLAGGLAARADAAEGPSPPLTREGVEEMIRQYILTHPEVLMESLRAFQERQQAQERERTAAALVARAAELLQDPATPVGGNPQGDVTVVEFFDYRCGYCQRMAATLTQLLAEDRNVRLVYKELPILGPESVLAARAALAARAQGKYLPFHGALLAAGGPLTLEEILKVARTIPLDTEKLQADMQAPEIQEALQRNRALAQQLGIRGTPAFIVGAELVPGALELPRLKELVAKARAR